MMQSEIQQLFMASHSLHLGPHNGGGVKVNKKKKKRINPLLHNSINKLLLGRNMVYDKCMAFVCSSVNPITLRKKNINEHWTGLRIQNLTDFLSIFTLEKSPVSQKNRIKKTVFIHKRASLNNSLKRCSLIGLHTICAHGW